MVEVLCKVGRGFVVDGVALDLDWLHNWIGLHCRVIDGLELPMMGGVIVTCMLVYFSSLFVMGFRLRDFRKVTR